MTMESRHHTGTVRNLARRRAVRGIAALAVMVGSLAACGGFVVGTANPNGCMIDSNAHGNLDHPHPSNTQQGEISGTLQVTCQTAPAEHQVEMALFRRPPTGGAWERIGGGTQTFGSSANFQATLHPYHIPCPGQEYSYQWTARHRYKPAGASGYELWSVQVFSDVNTFTC